MVKCIINAVHFYFFSRIMQEQGLLNQYSDLWTKDLKNPMFLNLQKNLNRLLESLELRDKNIILAVS